MNTTSSARSSDQLSVSLAVRLSRIGTHWPWIVLFVVLAAIACIPLYGVLFPPSADLSLHILISKLLWEKLAGVSHLDIEISWYLGYRLWAYLIVLVIGFCKALGMSLVNVPKLVAFAVVSIHATVIATIYYPELRTRSWRTWLPAICFAVPAVVCVYSSAWFTGFAGFTMAVSFVVAAIAFGERFLGSGNIIDAIVVFLALLMAFGSHPFAIAFWGLWCASRGLVSLPLLTIRHEWKRFIIIGVITLPVLVYHFLATANTEVLKPGEGTPTSPFLSAASWHTDRLMHLLTGYYVAADDLSSPRPFAFLAISLVVVAIVFVFSSSQIRELRAPVLACALFVIVGSWINEDFIPVPKGHWLAYDLRFGSAAFAIGLSIAGLVFIRSFSAFKDRRAFQMFLNTVALLTAVISIFQLFEVRAAYQRFDHPARAFVDKLFQHERPLRIVLPKSPWYREGDLFLRRYRCLEEPDCNPAGTLFQTIGGDVYPIRVKSTVHTLAYTPEVYGPPGNAFVGGCGYAGGEFAGPKGLAVDNAGNIYVADSGNRRVQKFDANGNFILTFGRYGVGAEEFQEPTGVAVDDQGDIYVADPPNQKVVRFRSDGTFVNQWKGPSSKLVRPIDIVIGPDGLLYITDLDRHAIVKLDPATGEATFWGIVGEGPGQFNRLAGIGIGGGMVFAADTMNDRVQIFDLNGTFIRAFDVKQWGKWMFHYPDIAYDEKNDLLYVTNGGWASEILVFTSDGKYVTVIKSDDDTELINPSSLVLTTTSQGKRLYVLNTGSEAKDVGDPRVSMINVGQ